MSSGGISSALSTLDPLGNKITQWGGDPLDLYGNQNNPSAAFFPSGTPASPIPGVLPNLGPASMRPQLPQGAFQAPSLGGGQFNAMAAQLAGPLFDPALRVIQPRYQPQSQRPAATPAPQMDTRINLPALLAAYGQSPVARGGTPYQRVK